MVVWHASKAAALDRLPTIAANVQEIMRILLGHIGKDRQADALVDKLLARFQGPDVMSRNLAFCLSQARPLVSHHEEHHLLHMSLSLACSAALDQRDRSILVPEWTGADVCP